MSESFVDVADIPIKRRHAEEPVTTKPTITIIAPEETQKALQALGADWTIDCAFTSTDDYWDALDNGKITGNSDITLLWAQCSGATTDIPGTAVSLSLFSSVWLFTQAGEVDNTKRDLRVYEKSLNMPGAGGAVQVAAMDSGDEATVLRRELRDRVVFTEESSTNAGPSSPAPKRPNLSAIEPDVTPIARVSEGREAYEQASVYSNEVQRSAAAKYSKPANARPGQTTLACMSSKGGAGKSTTALSLAGMIAQASKKAGAPKKVVVVDLDVRDGQVGSLIGQYLPTAVSVRIQPEWNAETVTANLVHDAKLGVDALLAPVRPRNADDLGPDFYRQVIQVLQTTHDVVILDCSVSYLDPLLGMAFSASDAILFVTTLATTSIQGMARALGEMFAPVAEGGLGIDPVKVGVVANQVMNNVGISKDQLFAAALGSPIVGSIPAAFVEVVVATNSTRLDKLLVHPQLGPAYFKLAQKCLPGAPLAPLV